MKKYLSILFVAIMLVLTMSLSVSADQLTDIDIKPGKLIEFNISSGNSYVDKFKPDLRTAGDYTFISFGDVCPKVTIKHTESGLLKSETISDTLGTEDGILFDTYTLSAGKEYTITVSGNGSFSIIFFKPDAKKCKFTSVPVKTSYFDKLEVSISGSKATFINDSLDLTGASFALVDTDGNTIHTVTGDTLEKIIKSATYEKNQIKLAVDPNKKFLGINVTDYSVLTLDVKPYPIKSVVLNHEELHYQYGDNDGRIIGTLKEHYFRPNIKFNEMTVNVTLTNGTKYENVNIKEDNGKYYFEIENIGKIYIFNESKCPEKGENINADVTIGATPYKLTVTIEKAGFFQKIGIFFKLLFGIYK